MNPTDYPVFLVYSREDEAWLARVDLLPGCVAEGKTAEEALANTKLAIENWIEISKELNRQIPVALDAQELEDMQIKAMEFQGAQIQQLIQQAVAQGIDQFQKAVLSMQSGGGEVRLAHQPQLFASSRPTTLASVL